MRLCGRDLRNYLTDFGGQYNFNLNQPPHIPMKTILYDTHVSLGAKIVEFSGWEMPIQYTSGILHEHHAVRRNAGIFDVSHMGRVLIEGPQAEQFLDYLSTNQISGRPDHSATYTVLPNSSGTCVDDVIIYRQSPTRFFLIVNAGNRQKDLSHIQQHASTFDVTVQDRFQEEGILAVQGPKALVIAQTIFPEISVLEKMQFVNSSYQNIPLIVATTGYTGEPGIEIYAPNSIITSLWDKFTALGAVPIGLGARDTLRLEMGYALYGHELSDKIYPHESVSSWTVKWKNREFLGKEAMLQRKSSTQLCQKGVILEDKGIPREGYPVLFQDQIIGQVTSGTFSPTLEKGIAIIQSDKILTVGDRVTVQIRQQQAKGTVVPLPFLQR